MADTAADVIVQTLINWNVDTIFGIPGDGINGIIEALRKKAEKELFDLCESVEDTLHLAVPEFTLPANPVIKVRRVTEGKVVEEITSIQGGGVLELVEEDVRCKHC